VEKKIIKNTVILSFANLLARAVGFFYFIFLGRILGVEIFGHYNFALALVYNFYPVADFGIERLILRDLSKDQSKAQIYFQKLIPLRLYFSAASIIIVTAWGLLIGKTALDKTNVFVFSLCLIPWTFNQLVAGIGNAFEKMEVQSVVAFGATFFTVVIGGTIARFGGSVTQILLAALFSNLIVSVIALRFSRKIGLRFKIDKDFGFIKKMLKESWIFALIMIMAVFYLRTSVILVNYFKGAYYTGLYSSAFKFIEASILIPQSFALALFPQTARLLKDNKKSLGINYIKSLELILIFALGYAVFFYFFAPLIIKLSYGNSYLEAVTVLRILGFAAIFFFLNTLPGNIIQNSLKVKKFLIFAFLNLVLVFIFGITLIPKYSIVGAAIAVLLAEVAGFVINNAFVWKILNEKS